MKTKIFTLLIVLAFPVLSRAEVNWQLQLGGMYLERYGTDVDFHLDNPYDLTKGASYELKGAVLLQIPLSGSVPVFLETGLGYRNKFTISQGEGYKFNPDYLIENPESLREFEFYRNNILEIPVKAGYKFALNEKSSLDFGLGPYVAMCTESGLGDPISVGLNISSSFRYRCMSFGLEWQNPLFVNGPRDYYKNSINLTFGINFKGRKFNINLDHLATVLEATGSALEVVSSSLQNSSGNVVNTSSYDQYDSGQYVSRKSSSTKSKKDKKATSEDSKHFSLSEQTAYNTDKKTYDDYDTLLAKYFSGVLKATIKEKEEWQANMKSIRLKWEKRGKSFPHSKNEDR